MASQAKNKTPKKEWDFSPNVNAPYDPLLGCLLIFSKIMNKPASPQALTAGLPLVDSRLTPDLFMLAAARAGFSTKIVKKKLTEIPIQQLPTILFQKNAQATVLTEVDLQKKNGESYSTRNRWRRN